LKLVVIKLEEGGDQALVDSQNETNVESGGDEENETSEKPDKNNEKGGEKELNSKNETKKKTKRKRTKIAWILKDNFDSRGRAEEYIAPWFYIDKPFRDGSSRLTYKCKLDNSCKAQAAINLLQSSDIGFRNSFGYKPTRVMCWTHTQRAIDKRLKSILNKKLEKQIMTDIRDIQSSYNCEVFNVKNEFFFVNMKL
jgi:hypothetical protein